MKNGVETTLPESGTVLEIILSCDTNRKLVIARQETDENGELIVKELTESDIGAEGTYYIDKANKRIHLFVNQLSTYAIGYYATTSSGGSGSTDASGTTPDGVKSANTGDIGLLPYAVMALSACTDYDKRLIDNIKDTIDSFSLSLSKPIDSRRIRPDRYK